MRWNFRVVLKEEKAGDARSEMVDRTPETRRKLRFHFSI